MNIEELHSFCLQQKGTTEHFPFDDVTLVFKVMGKMYALISLKSWENGEQKINLKCNPERAIDLRNEFEGINAGWHMNKKHWNTVTINQDVSDKTVFELINHSYELVVKGLTRKLQNELKSM